ncbi:Zn(II)2Cys6 transcription factor [Aspergillus stella-maris]|uniref:Zn(II)2Cys6 transcription factor n=1 Tax=Aspergillus stella-maris TaxID=1810926 RepID=UPI003CCD7FC3
MEKSCYTCRRRHIQCDRIKTPCLKCQKAGLECHNERPVRWVQGVAVRGNMRGRSYQSSSVCKEPVMSIQSQPVTSTDPPSCPNGLTPPSMPLSMKDGTLSQLSPSARYYLDYYNNQICQLFIVYDSENNPFRNLISIALGDTILLNAVLALAARHRANQQQPFSTKAQVSVSASTHIDQEALRFKYRAIQGLSKSINAQHSYQDETVASVFLLVFLDLLESGCDQWNHHLEGAKSLMTLRPSHDPGRTVERVRKFIMKQIHLIEALGATFVRPDLLSNPTTVDNPANIIDDVVEESFLGCPEYILTSVQFFSLQRDMIAGGTPSEPLHAEDITAVLHAVRDFDRYTWATSLPQESGKRDIEELCKLARVYQLGALLYGQRVLDAFQGIRSDATTVLPELIAVINSLRRSTLLKCILWPIFVAGLECQDQRQRDILIQALAQFWSDTYCSNVKNAAKILQEYWTKIDDTTSKTVASDWIFDIGSSTNDWLLI